MTEHVCDSGHFDRTICPEPCGMMHSFCATCGKRADVCAHEAAIESQPLTDEEIAAIREGLPHMACPKPGEVGACGCPDVYEVVERILLARTAALLDRLKAVEEALLDERGLRYHAEGERDDWRRRAEASHLATTEFMKQAGDWRKAATAAEQERDEHRERANSNFDEALIWRERAERAEADKARAVAEALRSVADNIAECAEAGWSAGQIATALNNRAIQAEDALADEFGATP